MMKRNKDWNYSSAITFSIGLLCGMGYFLAWYIFRHDGWKTAFNIPGFMLMALSMPWPLLAESETLTSALSTIVGQDGRVFLQGFLVSFGFATNLLLIKLFICMIFRKLKIKGINSPTEKNLQ